MSYLPYTDGSNGNGIEDIVELLGYLKKYPLAFYDHSFMASYKDLILEAARKNAVGIPKDMVPVFLQTLQLQEQMRYW
jgi:hypothetical protein